jgi:O-antigen/teichoic acid export membrane protein
MRMSSSQQASSISVPAPQPTISRSFAVLSAAQLISRFLGFLLTIHLTHVLLADHFGMIVFATSVLAYATLVAELGFDSYGPFEVARHTVPVHMLARTIMTLRLLLTALAFALLALFAWAAPVSDLLRLVLLLYGVSMLTDAVDLSWAFLGAELMRPTAIADIISQSLQTLGAFLLISAPEHVVRMPLIFLVARIAAVTPLLIWFARHFGWPGLGIDRTLLRSLLKGSLPLCGTTAVALVSHNFDLVLLGLWFGAGTAGIYGAAYRIVWMPTLLVVAYYIALRPSLARASVQGLETVESLLQRSTRTLTAVGVGVVVGGWLLAEPAVTFLYGAGYRDAVRPLQLLLTAFGLLVVSRTYRLILVAFHRQAVDFRIMALAAAVNILLNLLLVRDYGTTGAALASLASELFILAAGYLATRRYIQHMPLGRYLVRPLLCAAPMALVLALTPDLHLLLRCALGGGVYLLLLVALRVIDLQEVQRVFSA